MNFEVIEEAFQYVGMEIFGSAPFGPTPAQWDTWRPQGLPTAQSVVKQFVPGSKWPNKRLWSPLLNRAGLQYPPHSVLLAVAKGARDEVICEYVGMVLLGEVREGHASGFEREGLPVYVSKRVVRRWDPRRHRYVDDEEPTPVLMAL